MYGGRGESEHFPQLLCVDKDGQIEMKGRELKKESDI